MLTALRIKNLALVTELCLEFAPGYNTITGETGAGKSILIGALNLLLGQRADRNLIRAGEENCTVEAAFDLSTRRWSLAAFLERHGIEAAPDHQLAIRRNFTAAGTNRQFINGSPVTLQTLSDLGELLVDIHGPHEHQSLLHPSRQLELLDAFANLLSLREQFAALLRKRAEIQSQIAALVVDETQFAQQLDLLRHQVNEIQSARLQPYDEAELEADYHRAQNAARLYQLSQTALGLLQEEDPSLTSLAGALGRALQDIARMDPAAQPLTAEPHAQLTQTLAELQHQLSRYQDRLEIDPAQLQELEDRLNLVQNLKRKYGRSIAEIFEFHQNARQKLQSLTQRDEQLLHLEKERHTLEADLRRIGAEFSSQRCAAIPRVSQAVSRQLQDLGFKQSEFRIDLKSIPSGQTPPVIPPSGFDTIEFLFAPNPGEPPRPLRAIASSGEMARVMLALKTVLAAEDQIPVLVFDEVDANVGGATAEVVGQKMLQIARRRQVLCITHLAPVAALAATHFLVTKSTQNARTTSQIRKLDASDRVEELARMLGGNADTARKHARAMLNAKTI